MSEQENKIAEIINAKEVCEKIAEKLNRFADRKVQVFAKTETSMGFQADELNVEIEHAPTIRRLKAFFSSESQLLADQLAQAVERYQEKIK